MTVSPVGHSSGPLALSTIMGDDEDAIEEEEDDLFGPERRRGYRTALTSQNAPCANLARTQRPAGRRVAIPPPGRRRRALLRLD